MPVYARRVSYDGATPTVNEREEQEMDFDRNRLLQEARSAAARAYAPYSGFRVGAALLCPDGTVIQGANVENRSYGLTNCAERTAVCTAVSSGRRSFVALAVFTPDSAQAVPPCGACRQVLSEFAGGDLPVVYGGAEATAQTTLGELYPFDSLHELKGPGP